jgi:hypothetical protein
LQHWDPVLAALPLEPPPFDSVAPTSPPSANTASPSWSDIGRAALLDVLHGLTGGNAAADIASKLGSIVGSGDAAARAAAQRAADQAQQRQMIMVLGGLGAAVVLGAILLRGRS